MKILRLMLLMSGFIGFNAFAGDGDNVTPEFLTVKATAQALEWGETTPEFGLQHISKVTAASSSRSNLSIHIRLSYHNSAGFRCTTDHWYDFDGNSVTCDECRELNDGSVCACAVGMCESVGGTLKELKGGRVSIIKK